MAYSARDSESKLTGALEKGKGMEIQDLIRRDAEDSDLFSFVSKLGEKAEVHDTRGYTSNDSYVWVFKNTGLQISFDREEKVKAVIVFSGAVEGYKKYTAALPMGLTFETSRKTAVALLGNPTRTGGPAESVTDGSVFFWDRWDMEDYSLHLRYPQEKDAITILTIMPPNRMPM